MAGFRPKTDNPIFVRLLALARQYTVPVLIHVDAGSEQKFADVCRQNPAIRFIFAHAGGNLHANQIRPIIEQVWTGNDRALGTRSLALRWADRR